MPCIGHVRRLLGLAVLAGCLATGVTAGASGGSAPINVTFALRGNAKTSVAVPTGYTVRFIARASMRRGDSIYMQALRVGDSALQTVARCNRSPCYGSWREPVPVRVLFQASLVRPVDAKTDVTTHSRTITVRWYTGSGTGTTPTPPQQPGFYEGQTADGQPWQFYVSADGRSVVSLSTGELNESCNQPRTTLSGGNLSLPGPYPIAADGSFSIATTLDFLSNGSPAVDNVKITGRISSGTATGIYHVDTSVSVKDRDGNTTNITCTTGDQTWRASKV